MAVLGGRRSLAGASSQRVRRVACRSVKPIFTLNGARNCNRRAFLPAAVDGHGVDHQTSPSLAPASASASSMSSMSSTSLASASIDDCDLPQIQRPVPGRPAWLTSAVQLLDKRPDRVTGLVLLNIMTLLCGSNWVVVKHAEQMLDPMVFAALRFGIAGTACMPILLTTKQSSAVVKAGVEIGAYMAMGYLMQSFALQTADASRASLLSTFTVLTVPIIAGLNGQHIKPLVWLCCLGSVFGTSLLEQSGQPPNIGDLLSVVSAVFFGIQIYRTEIVSKTLPASAALQVTAIAMLTVAVTASAAAVAQHSAELAPRVAALAAHVPHATWADTGAAWGQLKGLQALPWGELMYTGIMSTVMVLVIEMLALNTVSSTEAAVIYTAEPLCGAMLAYCFLGERWGMLGWVGAAIITTCSLATQLGGGEEPPAASGSDAK